MNITKKLTRGVNMNKKIGVSILIGVLVLMGFISITKFAYGDMLDTTNTNIVAYGDGYGYDNTTKGGITEIVNLTIKHDGVSGSEIAEINITWSGNLTFNGFINEADLVEDFGDATNESDPHTNVTILGNGSTSLGWACYNNSGGSLTTQGISCYNFTDALLSASNPTLIIRFNVTADASIEDRNTWEINVTDYNATRVPMANTTLLYTYVDGLAPRLYSLNISDGNMTYNNGSFNGTNFGGYATYLDANSDLAVKATFYELSPSFGSMRLYYNLTDDTKGELGLYETSSGNTNATIQVGSCVPGALANAAEVDGGWAHRIECGWTIPKSNSISGWNETIIFGFNVNDTLNQETTINDTSARTGSATYIPFTILVNETLPYVSSINVSDEYENSLTTLDGTGYLNGNTTIVFTVAGGPRAAMGDGGAVEMVAIYYNETGVLNSLTSGIIEDYNSIIDVNANISGTDTYIYNLTSQDTASLINGSTSLYSVGLTAAGDGNDTKTISFVIVIGNTSFDNINGNYTRTEGPYSFIIDTAVPGITVERMTQNSGINQYDATGVEYKCTATEQSGIQKYVWTLDKPSSADDLTVTHEVNTASDTITFKENDLNVLGEYLVKCKVYDNVDNVDEKITTSAQSFTVSSSTSVAAGAGGAAGGAAVVSFDIDFTTANEGTLKAQQGRVKSFSFDGVTKHTVTFMEVTGTSATLKIESTPVTVTLNVKDTKNVDVNGDGANDMSVVLNSIVNGVADVTIKKIEEGAAKIVKEEEGARGVTEEQQEVTPVGEGKGTTWLWILIAVIVIAGLAYYFFNKKK